MMTSNVSLNSGMQNVTSTKVVATNNESNELQSQLVSKQQDLKHISSDSEMSAAEKKKEQQKLQQQIAELNRELRQQKIEEQKKAAENAKKQEKKVALKEDILKETSQIDQKTDEILQEETQQTKEHESIEEAAAEDVKLTAQNVQEMLTNEFLIQQERVQTNMARQREQQKNIVESEISLDAIHGSEDTPKQEALSKMEKKEKIILEVQENMNNPVEPSVGIRTGAKIIIRED